MKVIRALQIPSKETCLEFSKLTPKERLEWLEEANEFVNKIRKLK